MPTLTSHRPLDSSTDLPEGFSSFYFILIPLFPALPIALSYFTRDMIFMKFILTSHFWCLYCCWGLLTVCIIKTRDTAKSFFFQTKYEVWVFGIYTNTDTDTSRASWNILLSSVYVVCCHVLLVMNSLCWTVCLKKLLHLNTLIENVRVANLNLQSSISKCGN